MTALSVVVADAGPSTHAGDPLATLTSLAAELEAGDQLVWVDAAGRGPERPHRAGGTGPERPHRAGGTGPERPHRAENAGLTTPGRRVEFPIDVDHVAGGSPASRGHLYARGLAVARHPLVGFTDSATEVEPGWRAAAVAGLGDGAAVVGGPVLPRAGISLVTAAGFFVEYGPHAVPPYTSASGDVSANNVAYRRADLDRVLGDGEPVWKSEVNRRLAASGQPPVLVEGMRVRSSKTYGWGGIGPGRFSPGRLYGTQRAGSWPLPRRVAGAAGCAVLPGLAYARLLRRIGTDASLRASFAAATPLVLVALTAWSAGEAWGYLLRDWNGHDVF